MFVQGKSSSCSRRKGCHSIFSLEETSKGVSLFHLVGCSISSPYASAPSLPEAYQSRAIESRAAVRVGRWRSVPRQGAREGGKIQSKSVNMVWEKLPLEKGLLRDERVMALLKDHSISNSFFCLSIPPWCLFVFSV